MVEMIRMIRPTSKMALRQQCLLIARGDVEEARRLCDYYCEGMDDLPMFDPPQPTWMDNTKNTLEGLFGWVRDNKGGLMDTYEVIRGISGGKLPPLGGVELPSAEEPLPPIND